MRTPIDYIIVNTTEQEFDYPVGDDNALRHLRGQRRPWTWARCLNRLLFAWQFGDANILLTGAITPE